VTCAPVPPPFPFGSKPNALRTGTGGWRLAAGGSIAPPPPPPLLFGCPQTPKTRTYFFFRYAALIPTPRFQTGRDNNSTKGVPIALTLRSTQARNRVALPLLLLSRPHMTCGIRPELRSSTPPPPGTKGPSIDRRAQHVQGRGGATARTGRSKPEVMAGCFYWTNKPAEVLRVHSTSISTHLPL
jgi:hypothetical protein